MSDSTITTVVTPQVPTTKRSEASPTQPPTAPVNSPVKTAKAPDLGRNIDLNA